MMVRCLNGAREVAMSSLHQVRIVSRQGEIMHATSYLLGVILLVGGEPKTATLRGSVMDAAGKPISGARIDIATAAPRFGEGLFCPSCYRDCAKGARSDNEGRFGPGSKPPIFG
jgi:hypothetical protein